MNTSPALERVLNLLRDRGPVTLKGKDWSCICPAHEDTNPSLDVMAGRDGRVLFRCRSRGCSVESIIKALGLSFADLFANDIALGKSSFEDRILATYSYHDEQGNELFQAVRLWAPAPKNKDFRQRHRVGSKWEWNLNGTRRVLYKLPELKKTAKDATVYVCEGEKDVENLIRCGLVATTNPMGAGKWKPEYAEMLRDKNVIVLADNDEPGQQHATTVWKSLLGVATSAKIVTLPDLPPKGDVSDWIADQAAGAAESVDYRAIGVKLEQFCAAFGPKQSTKPETGLVSRSLAEVETRLVSWLWPGRVPFGMFTMLDGDPSKGKSLITIDLAARLSSGRPMPFCEDAPGESGAVLIIAAEDAAETVIKPRAVAAEADLNRIRVSETIRIGEQERPIRFPDDFELLEREIVEHGIRLVIIDPLLGFLSQSVDSNKDQSVRDVLHQLKLLAERTGAAIIGLRHLSKAGNGNPLYRGMSSIAIVAAARSALAVDSHPTERGLNVLATTKCNLVAMPRSLTYRVQDLNGQPFVSWVGECNLTAEDLGVRDRVPGGDGAKDEAIEFLRDELKNGPVLVSELTKLARTASISTASLRRAKDELKVESFKDGFGASAWSWKLPDGSGTVAIPE